MNRHLRRGLGSAYLAILCLSIGACSDGGENTLEAKELAIRACTTEATQSREGFNPQAASVSELSKLAETAQRRSELADQAAALNERWLLLSEASAAIADFAQELLQLREEGATNNGAISLSMWDDYKAASNAYLAECQSAVKDVSNPSPETDNMNNASTSVYISPSREHSLLRSSAVLR